MDLINQWAVKNMFISIFSIVHNGNIEWTVGVRVGKCDKNEWLSNKDEGCSYSSFNTYDVALQQAIKFCENYKPKNTRVVSVQTKRKK